MKKWFYKYFLIMISPIITLILFLILSLFTSCGTKKKAAERIKEKTQIEISSQETKTGKIDLAVKLLEQSEIWDYTFTPIDATKPAKVYQENGKLVTENAKIGFSKTKKESKENTVATAETKEKTKNHTTKKTEKDNKTKTNNQTGTKSNFWWWLGLVIIGIVAVRYTIKKIFFL